MRLLCLETEAHSGPSLKMLLCVCLCCEHDACVSKHEATPEEGSYKIEEALRACVMLEKPAHPSLPCLEGSISLRLISESGWEVTFYCLWMGSCSLTELASFADRFKEDVL